MNAQRLYIPVIEEIEIKPDKFFAAAEAEI